jgi:chemotaxis protein MotB
MAKKKGGGHHGGAWKVAYADFVTAMMALFMVLWICGQNEEIKKATSRFFQDPYNALPAKNSGTMPNQIAGANKDTPESDPTAQKDTGYLQALARDFYRLLNVPDEQDKPVTVEVTSDGLKITLYNRARRPLFVGQTAEFTEWGRFVVQTLAWLIERHEFRVYIDGHSERAKFEKPEYGPWELSSDRANAARRSLEYYAVDGRKIERVTGFGDTVSLPGIAPEADGNARITVSLSMEQKPLPKGTPAKKAGAEKEATAKEEPAGKDERDHDPVLATKTH